MHATITLESFVWYVNYIFVGNVCVETLECVFPTRHVNYVKHYPVLDFHQNIYIQYKILSLILNSKYGILKPRNDVLFNS